MHINTESKNYSFVRTGIDFAAFTGGCVAVDSVFVPMIMAVFDKKFKFMRPIGYLGAWAFSVAGGALATSIIDDYTTALVDAINIKDAEKKAKKTADISYWFNEPGMTAKKQYLGIDIPEENATSDKEKEFVDALVEKTTPFEFESLAEAQDAVEKVMRELDKNGFYPLSDYYKSINGRKLPQSVIDICLTYGWALSDFIKKDGNSITVNQFIEVDKIASTCYIVNLFGYHDISDKYVTYEED